MITRERRARPADPAPALSSALMPVLARVLEVGGGPPALRNWVRSAAGAESGVAKDDGLVRDLARRLADRLNRGGLWGTLAHEHGQTVRAERPGLEGRHAGEAAVAEPPDE